MTSASIYEGNGGRIVITGLGIISPAGDSMEDALRGVAGGTAFIKKLEKNDYSTMPVRYGGEIPPGATAKYGLDPIKFKGFQNYIQYGVIAARNALSDSGLFDPSGRGAWKFGDYDETRRGAFVSTGVNGNNAEALFEAFSVSGGEGGALDLSLFASEGATRVHPKWILTALSNNLIFFITSEFGLKGDNNNATYSAAGGAYMLAAAERSLREGACDMALVCGADSILNWQAVDELVKLGILSDARTGGPVASMAAFTDSARGALPAEGAAALVLEREDAAKKRGARIYAAIEGCAQFCEGTGGAPSESAEGFIRVFEKLLSGAGRLSGTKRTVVSLNSAAIGAWDAAEIKGAAALAEKYPGFFDGGVKLAGLKPYFGHTFSASFVVETAVAAAALERGCEYGLPHSPQAPAAVKKLFETNFNGEAYGAAVVMTSCVGGNYAGVALAKSQA